MKEKVTVIGLGFIVEDEFLSQLTSNEYPTVAERRKIQCLVVYV